MKTPTISERTLRISGASALAVLFMGTSYLVSGPSFLTNKFAQAGTTEELLKAYAAKDTDADGLPDWQEALYNTDPNKPDTDGDGVTDGEAAKQGLLTPNSLKSQLPTDSADTITQEDLPGVDPAPGSITEQFSHEFFQQFVEASNGQQMDDATKQALIQKLMTQFSGQAAKTLISTYSSISVHTSTSVTVAAYIAQVESILRAHDVPADSSDPFPLMEDLIEKNDETARPKLEAISSAYAGMAADLKAAQVPPSLVSQHVALVRALDTLARSTKVVTGYETDPLGTLGAITAHQTAAGDLGNASKDLASIVLQSGEPAAGEPGSLIIQMARAAEDHE